MAYAKEIIYSYIIIFTAALIIGGGAGAYLLVTEKIDTTGFSAILGAACVGATAVCAAMSNNIKYIQGIVCPYGVYPECGPARFALEHGYK